jgi:sigma-B regulation protein RsbU (phosphoserine phosphatase)
MQLAEEIQKALIPTKLPTVPGLDIGTIYKAARMVGGDLFDIVRMDDHTVAVAVADVSGKGVPGSLVMAMVRTALRLECRERRSAREILIKINEFVAEHIKQGMFVTILLAIIDTETKRIDFASAGHNPIIHFVNRTQEGHFLNAPGMPVGIKSDRIVFADVMKGAEITLAEDDFLLIYTDGVSEGRGRHKGAYGTSRIIELLKENGGRSAGDMAQVIESDIARFVGKEDQFDDITMVILKNSPAGHGLDSPEQTSAAEQPSGNPASQIDSLTLKSDQETA